MSGKQNGGRFTSALAKGLSTDLRRAEQDPKLLSIERDIALIEVRLSRVMFKIGSSGASVKAIRQAFESLMDAQARKDVEAAAGAIRSLRSAITESTQEEDCWREARELMEQRRRAIESISRCRKREVGVIPVWDLPSW